MIRWQKIFKKQDKPHPTLKHLFGKTLSLLEYCIIRIALPVAALYFHILNQGYFGTFHFSRYGPDFFHWILNRAINVYGSGYIFLVSLAVPVPSFYYWEFKVLTSL